MENEVKMFHPSSVIDEVDEEKLVDELCNRLEKRSLGVCDYCFHDPTSQPCKFPGRHKNPPLSRTLFSKYGKLTKLVRETV